jgi:hypothetical protein
MRSGFEGGAARKREGKRHIISTNMLAWRWEVGVVR